MEERNNFDKNAWYRPVEQSTDLFEEAGLYQIKSRQELYEKNHRKPRKRGLFIGIACAVVLIAAIVVTAKLFGEDDQQANGYGDYYDAYSDFYEQMQGSNAPVDYPMERADTNPKLKLNLQGVGQTPLTLQELYVKCTPSIVGITTYVDGTKYSWGTGVVMTADGYIITNAHVVASAEAATVTLSDGTVCDAKLVGADTISDIALLKIEAEGLTAADFVDSELVQVGDEAIAIGNPISEQFSGSMSTGIISGLSRSVNYRGRDLTLLQTDASLNHGNSGGALFNIYGQVVGITNMKMTGDLVTDYEGVGFAIPTVTVKEMVESILSEGAVVGRPGLGINVYDVSDLGDLNKMVESEFDFPDDGMLVSSVTVGSDAEKKGLQTDDIIIEIDGEAAESIEVIRACINEKQVGDTVHVVVWREGETIELDIVLMDQNDM